MATKKKPKLEEKNREPLIVIRRIKKVDNVPHTGSWKIAYADFVTAMMAFFLLMWLLANTDQEMRDDLQQVFTSYKIFTSSGQSQSPSQTVQETKEVAQKLKSNPDILERLGKDIKLDRMQSSDPGGKLQISHSPLGVSIQVMDTDKSTPMFESGEAKLTPDAVKVLQWLAIRLEEWPYKIIIEGHTDAKPFAGNKKTNIHLSTLRALAARNELSKNGIEKRRFLKVIGHGANKPLIKKDINNSKNRRINITILSFDKELNDPDVKDYFE
jgi:chemotaxis protein MotB